MKSFHEYIDEYRKQLEKGDIKEAYKGLMEYINDLRLHLKNKYPEHIEQIDQLVAQLEDKNESSDIPSRYSPVITTRTDSQVSQVYAKDSSEGIKDCDKNIEIWECYLKDNSVFVEGEDSETSLPGVF